MSSSATATPGASAASPRVKPRYRGVSHEIAFYAAIVATAMLVYLAAPGTPRIVGAIYGASLVTLFGTSALYHRPMWQPTARARMRRADHAAIFVLIAGSYCPMGLLALPPHVGQRLLMYVWAGCGLGVVKSLFWAHAPRWLTVTLYIVVSWLVVLELPALGRAIGTLQVTLMLLGGVCYSVGALIYARRKPDPIPAVFGYHELFHLLVIAAAISQFAALSRVVLDAPAD